MFARFVKFPQAKPILYVLSYTEQSLEEDIILGNGDRGVQI